MALMEVGGGPLDDDVAERLRQLPRAGALGTGVFATDDCRATYEQLSARGGGVHVSA